MFGWTRVYVLDGWRGCPTGVVQNLSHGEPQYERPNCALHGTTSKARMFPSKKRRGGGTCSTVEVVVAVLDALARVRSCSDCQTSRLPSSEFCKFLRSYTHCIKGASKKGKLLNHRFSWPVSKEARLNPS